MSKMNFKPKQLLKFIVFFLLLLLTSCASNEEKATGLGFFILILFLLCWGASIFLPKVQENKKIKAAVTKSKQPVRIASNLLTFIFAVLAIFVIFSASE